MGDKDNNRMAFLLLAHADPTNVLRLCSRLSPHAIFLHVDKKADPLPFCPAARLPNVHMLKERLPVHWGDFSVVSATLSLMRAAASSGERYEKYILLSGACYPAKPVNQLWNAIRTDRSFNHIQLVPIKGQSHLQNLIGRKWRMSPLLPQLHLHSRSMQKAERLGRRFYNAGSKLFPRNLKRELGGAEPFFGSQWWGMSHEAVCYVLDFVKQNPCWSEVYRSVYAPDEQFFHTIIANSPFFATTSGHQPDLGARTLQGAPLHLIHPSAGRNFTDIPSDYRLALGTDKFFIRKVSSQNCPALLDVLDEFALRDQ